MKCRANTAAYARETQRPTHSYARQPRKGGTQSGMTLLELIIACGILLVLATVSVPLTRVVVISRKERALRADLLEMRTAIDRYKDDADQNKIQVQAGTEGYPPDLQTLVNGVQLTGAQDQKVRYLRKIPTDPFTGDTNWGLRSAQDDSDATQWGGQDVFDVYSRSQGTALDGTKYSDW
jgi:general secretion pathway protein G